MGYGKIFESLYTGSMVGSGLNVFALWAYCIANAKPPGSIELNPKILATTFGCTVTEVEDAIAKLCQPDPQSRTDIEEGRRLVQEGQFLYVMPTWPKYNAIRNEVDRRLQNRESQRRWRERKKGPSVRKVSRRKPSPSSSSSTSTSPSSGEGEREREDRSGRPDDVSEQVWGDWQRHRKAKRATVSETVIGTLRKQATDAGMTLQEAMAYCVAQGHQGFFPPNKGKTNGKGNSIVPKSLPLSYYQEGREPGEGNVGQI